MIIYKNALQLNAHIQNIKTTEKKIGFVPTMGALHDGHLSLIRAASKINAFKVCSIFVNPTQFTDQDDFDRYPKTIEKDIEMLVQAGCDVLFFPPKSEVYTQSFVSKNFPLGSVELVLEGHFRPGHFQGVCQVVDRLLNIVQPDILYLGQKDYQQCMVIQKLLSLTNKESEIELLIEPTQRESDGLALSSRNMRLNDGERKNATAIFQALLYIKDHIDQTSFPILKEKAFMILKEKGFTVDYVEIANRHTLEPALESQEALIALIAARLGNVRLIDNMLMN